MATIHHHHSPSSTTSQTLSRPRRHSLDYSTLSSSTTTTNNNTNSSSIYHHNSLSLSSHIITFSSLSSTTTPTSSTPTTSLPTSPSLDTLENHLAASNFRLADEVTRRLLIHLAGEPAIKRGYVFFSEVQFIPKEDLLAIDQLWKKFSNNRFGYSVQKKIWLNNNKDFTKFFIKVGWMKKLDTEIEQYNYRAFPNEFLWELNPPQKNDNDDDDVGFCAPPEGHLPLTNALRGTQLLTCIFTHPAFAEEGETSEDAEGQGGGNDEQGGVDEVYKKKSRFAALRDKLFKPNYSF